MNPPPRILFPIAVDPSALLDFKDSEHKQTHVVAAQLLREYGILSFGPGDKQPLLCAIGKLSGRPHQAWKGVVEYLKVSRREDDRSRTSSLAEFLQSAAKLDNSADVVRLAVVAMGAANRTQTARSGSNTTERVTLPDIDESKAVTDAGGIGTFQRRTSRSAVAEQLLRPLATRSTDVKIMDPHILESLVTKNAQLKYDRPANVEWLLGVLGDVMPSDSTISLIGTLQGGWSPRARNEDVTRIDGFIGHALRARTKPLTVGVHLVQGGTPLLKNRFLWFDCGSSFDVLHNFAPLNADPLREELRFTRQDEATAKQTCDLAQSYENFIESAKIGITKTLP